MNLGNVTSRIVVLVALMGARMMHAQADRVDAGSFTILKAGQRVGREQFSWRRLPSPDGATFELRAESDQGDRRTTVQLSTDSTGSPVRYAVEIRDATSLSIRLGGQRVRGRFATQLFRATGEGAREYLLTPGTFVLETDLFHQLGVVLRGRNLQSGESVTVPVISPLDNAQRELRISLESADDSVTVAGVRKTAHRWRLEERGGITRTVWGDAQGRILRVLLPSLFLEAVRDDIPR